jgi:uncharacterized protein
MAADRLLIFCTEPLAGRVKTSLVPPLSPDDAAALYEASLRDVIALAARERARVELWYDTAAAGSFFEREFPHLTRYAQSGGALGERQRDAFERSFKDQAERVAILASDAPTLPESHLNAAFDDLREAPAVAGPTRSGGCYLVGLQSQAWPRAAALFDGITATDVLSQTIQRAADSAIELRMLPGWYHLDVEEDLSLVRADAAPNSHVARWLSERSDY